MMKRIVFLMGCMGLFLGMNAQTEIPKNINDLFIKHTCFTCHKTGGKLIGPSWEDIAAKAGKKSEIVASILKPNPSNWPGYPPMAPMPQVPTKDLEKIADWILKIKPKSK
jgi:cytochrome c